MACFAQFAEEIPYGCILEIVNEIRANKLGIPTAKKALWVIGCVLNTVDGVPDGIMKASGEEIPDTADGIAAMLFELCPTVDPTADPLVVGERWRPNPENMKLLLELLLKLLPLIIPVII